VVRDTAAAQPAAARRQFDRPGRPAVGPRRLLQLSLVLAAAAVLLLALTGVFSSALPGMAAFGS
jgi:hypothetical protein